MQKAGSSLGYKHSEEAREKMRGASKTLSFYKGRSPRSTHKWKELLLLYFCSIPGVKYTSSYNY